MLKFLVVSLTLISVISHADELKSRGIAKNKKGEVVYIENHISRFKDGKLESITTQYSSPKNGVVFAELSSDFSDSAYFPYSSFLDTRFEHIENVEKTDKNNEYLIKTRKNKKKKLKTEMFTPSKEVVGGQGLHNFVLRNFDKFKKKNHREKVNFFIPVKCKSYLFSIVVKKITKTDLILNVEIKNWFIRLFAPTIRVSYDLKTKRLTSYKGLSNIGDKKGKGQNVEITYEYFDNKN